MTRKVTKKSALEKPRPEKSMAAKNVVRDALPNPEAMLAMAMKSENAKRVKADRIAKVVHITVSIGNDDRARTFENFVKWIEKTIGRTPYGKPGVHTSVTGGHYVVDGKVCRPEDYDPKKQTFKVGAQPPPWAGGPSASNALSQQQQIQYDLEHLSEDAFDKKYKIGKYTPPEPPRSVARYESSADHDARMRRERAERKAAQDEELEEFEWDEDDVLDDEKMGRAADESAKRAIKRIKRTNNKPTAKKVVRRIKK